MLKLLLDYTLLRKRLNIFDFASATFFIYGVEIGVSYFRFVLKNEIAMV